MSHASVTQCSTDKALMDRVSASIAKEAFNNADFADTKTTQQVKQFGPQSVLSLFMYPIAIDNEAAYQYAIETDNPNPGGDPGVISDGAITSGTVAYWPVDGVLVVGVKYTIQVLDVVP